MLPIMLGCAGHDQQRAVPQLQRVLDTLVALAAQVEAPGSTKIERGNQRIAPQLGFVVTVPAHGVLAIAVIVEQHAVQRLPRHRLNLRANLCQQGCPGQRLVQQAGIAIAGLGIAIPGHQAWHRIVAAVKEDLRLLPRRLGQQLRQPLVGTARIQPVRAVIQLGIRQLQGQVGE